ncbi:DUF2510 domain-containing protein [Streptomyces albidoflavus]|uniref:DUF2510 domain-containing protein n=1 Tax=Streptomyces albidoflavus TaxID=1886 RepID=UPI00226F7023|nr:DUF2510 domain-containing protein [Streptomyces albidoflavus]CAI4153499.1 Membrane protein [Streptomyces albidoflavus]
MNTPLPPPGWYVDPAAPPPAVERWWDGTGWTAHTPRPRTAPGPAAPAARLARGPDGGFGPPPARLPGSLRPRRFRAAPPPRARPLRPRGTTAALIAGAVVVAACVVGGVVLLGGGDTPDDARPTAAPTSAVSEAAGTPTPTPTQGPTGEADPRVLTDDLNGITLPVPEGWTTANTRSVGDVAMVTDPSYDCPGGGNSGFCYRGRITSATLTGSDETDPKAVAEADISEAADDLYDRDTLDRRPYDGVTAKEKAAAGQVAVAGRAGYYVRWRVTTGAGEGGWVQSLAFRSSAGSEAMVVVRFAFDAGSEGPPLSLMDTVVKGIEPVGGSGGTGGVGEGLTPAPGG